MRFSIVIPTRNRPVHLDRCLSAIALLNYPRTGFEVLIVDDGSDPPPDDIVARHASVLPLRYCHHDGKGPAGARNRGLREARGDYVVFTDDDCGPQVEWLDAFDRAFRETPGAGLGGSIVGAPGNGIYGAVSQLLITFLYTYAEATGRLRFFCTNNIAFPRQALLDRTGGFDEAFPLAAAEDRDLCARWLLRGELRFVRAAVVQHRQDLTLLSFCAQHFRYGRGAFRFWSRRRAEGGAEHRLESWRFYGQMLAFPFSRASAPRALAMSGLLALSQLVCATGYFAEGAKNL